MRYEYTEWGLLVGGGIRPGSVENEMLTLELGERTAMEIDDEECFGSPFLYLSLGIYHDTTGPLESRSKPPSSEKSSEEVSRDR